MIDDGSFMGQARRRQKQLVQTYYDRLQRCPDDDIPVAYLFVGGNLTELLRGFGYEVAFPEIVALGCAIKHDSLDNIRRAEEMGYGTDVCGYVKNDIGMHDAGGQTPFGEIPPADLLTCSFSGCFIYVKWFEALAERMDAPMVTFDVPYQRTDQPRDEDVDYMVAQLKELIDDLEDTTGRTLDMGELRHRLDLARQAEQAWVRFLEAGMEEPTPIEAFFEAVFYMFPINVLRGTEEAVSFYETVNDDVQDRIEAARYPVEEERIRILVEGVPPYPHYRSFWNLFREWGAVSVAATYPKVGGLFDRGFLHDPDRPLESIAEYSLGAYVNQSWQQRRDIIADYIDEYDVDAVVIHGIKSCRSFTAGQGDLREYIIEELDTPALYIESDHEDPRYFSEAQIKNRVDAFFESLEHKRTVAAGEGSP